MIVECGVIAAFFLMISLVFFRRQNKEWAFASLPLILVPLSYVVLQWIVINLFHANVSLLVGFLVILIAVSASAVWIGVMSQKMKDKKTSLTYASISNTFNIVLAAIIVGSMLKKSGVFDFLIN